MPLSPLKHWSILYGSMILINTCLFSDSAVSVGFCSDEQGRINGNFCEEMGSNPAITDLFTPYQMGSFHLSHRLVFFIFNYAALVLVQVSQSEFPCFSLFVFEVVD